MEHLTRRMGIEINDELKKTLDGRLLVLFDGHCALCNGAVRWLLKRDRRDRLRFAPLERFAELAKEAGETIVVVRPEVGVVTHSDAVLAAMMELPHPWRLVARALAVVPRSVRDWFYRLVAQNRFRLKKRLMACPVPSEAERRHFLCGF